MIKKLIAYLVIGIISNIGLIAGINTIFGNKILVEYHLEKSILIVALILFLLSYFSFIYILSKVFDSNILKIISNSIIGISISLLGLNVITAITSIFNIVSYNDEVYSCKFFTLYYKYSKVELLKFIETYYSEISTIDKKLLATEKLLILKDAKTIKEVKANVEEYCVYEQTAWWPKITKFLTSSIDFIIQNPSMSIAVGAGISTIVGYFGYHWFLNKYNIHSVAVSVSETNQAVSELNNVAIQLRLSLQSTNEGIRITNIIQSKILGMITKIAELNCEIIDGTVLDTESKINLISHTAQIVHDVQEIVVPDVEIPVLSEPTENTKITFSGTGYQLGGERTTSNLIN